MKTSLYMALIALTSIVSISSHAIPPVPPSPATSEPRIVICRSFIEFTKEEIEQLEKDVQNDSEKIVSLDQESGEICLTK